MMKKHFPFTIALQLHLHRGGGLGHKVLAEAAETG